MKLRCPYCRHTFGPDPRPKCPKCGKIMSVPDHLLGRKRQVKADRRRRDTDEEDGRQKMLTPTFAPGRSASTVIFGLAALVVAGGLLVARLSSRLPTPKSRSRAAIATRELRVLRIALDRFHADCGRYPTAEEGLEGLVNNPGIENWAGHYITLLRPDPWRTHYWYELRNGEPVLFSLGKDRVRGTADDLHPPPDARE